MKNQTDKQKGGKEITGSSRQLSNYNNYNNCSNQDDIKKTTRSFPDSYVNMLDVQKTSRFPDSRQNRRLSGNSVTVLRNEALAGGSTHFILTENKTFGGCVFVDFLLCPQYSFELLVDHLHVLIQMAGALVSALDRVRGGFQTPSDLQNHLFLSR